MSTAPAGLLRRYAAWSLDMALLSAVAMLASLDRIREAAARACGAFEALVAAMARSMLDVLAQGGTPWELAQDWLADAGSRGLVSALVDAVGDAVFVPLLLLALLALAWSTLWEGSARQATPGKQALGLRVVDAAGGSPGVARAAGRHLAGALSWLTLNIGHLLAMAPPQYQALHDRIAGTRVLGVRPDAALPGWAWAWLALQALATLAALAWLFAAMQAAMQRALDALLLF